MDRTTWKSEFRARFEACEEELRARYMELYHGDEAAWDYFTGMLYCCWQGRSADLKKLADHIESTLKTSK